MLLLGLPLIACWPAVAQADASYGYGTGSSPVTATANLRLKVTVPKLIVLRVGGVVNTGGDELAWTLKASIPTAAGPVIPVASASPSAVPWNGTAPAMSIESPAGGVSTVQVFAWTNASSASLTCTYTAGTAGGPAASQFSVGISGTAPPPHPGATLAACSTVTLNSNTLYNGNWIYTLTAPSAGYPAGVYNSSVVYSATGV